MFLWGPNPIPLLTNRTKHVTIENMSDLKYWLGFNIVKGIGAAKLRALREHFGSMEVAWEANSAELTRMGLDKRTIASFLTTRSEIDLEGEMEKLDRMGVDLLCWESPNYPAQLRDIPASPPVIYVKGDLLDTDRWAIAIVGTRRLTAYGRQMTHALTSGLVRHDITIVSGLARGIDSIAHKAAVEQGGRTIGVLACGIDCIYPPENRKLAEQIADGQGAVISEHALGVQPEKKNFPPRNRIISGLSLGTVVVEAAKVSGALITTKFAREQGREVYAVPGNANSRASKGTNNLIKQGGKLVTEAQDILEDLNLERAPEQQAVQMILPDSAEEATLIPLLIDAPRHVDELSRESGLPAPLVSSTLVMMELKGQVQQIGGMQYALLREAHVAYEAEAQHDTPQLEDD